MMGRVTRKDMMPLTLILKVEIFYLWVIDFMGPFPMSYGLKLFQLRRIQPSCHQFFKRKYHFTLQSSPCDNKR